MADLNFQNLFLLILCIKLMGCSSHTTHNESYPQDKNKEINFSDSSKMKGEDLSLTPLIDTSPPDLHTNNTHALELSLINQGLVNVQEVIPSVKIDLKYASVDNFLEEDVYQGLSRCYLQPEVVDMLSDANNYLTQRYPELVFLIFDGVRPQSVQYKMWEIVKNTPMQKYVAEPGSGSMHNFGAAVDLSLYHLDTGEVDMGTPYDYFGPLAQPRYEIQYLASGELSTIQIENRRILRAAMLSAGFSGILSEWWHFNAFPRDTARERFTIIK